MAWGGRLAVLPGVWLQPPVQPQGGDDRRSSATAELPPRLGRATAWNRRSAPRVAAPPLRPLPPESPLRSRGSGSGGAGGEWRWGAPWLPDPAPRCPTPSPAQSRRRPRQPALGDTVTQTPGTRTHGHARRLAQGLGRGTLTRTPVPADRRPRGLGCKCASTRGRRHADTPSHPCGRPRSDTDTSAQTRGHTRSHTQGLEHRHTHTRTRTRARTVVQARSKNTALAAAGACPPARPDTPPWPSPRPRAPDRGLAGTRSPRGARTRPSGTLAKHAHSDTRGARRRAWADTPAPHSRPTQTRSGRSRL